MRRAHLRLTYELLHQLLKLPDDVEIIRIEDARDDLNQSLIASAAHVYLSTASNPGIPTVHEGCAIPRVEYLLVEHSATEMKGEFR